MEKIKRFLEGKQGKDILTVLIVVLVGLGSFGLGRLSKNVVSEGLKIEYTEGSLEASIAEATTTKKNFFASKRGSKYYSLGCSGGKTIKQENRVFFNTKEEAEKAGYELSVSCK
jgi:hypothetical protein